MKRFNGKAIYNPSGKAGEYSYWACNFYVGCSNGCTYCYCKKGIMAGAMGGDFATLKKCFRNEEHALQVFEKELLHNLTELQKHGLFFTFTSDPCLSTTLRLTINAIGVCIDNDVPFKLLSKNAQNSLDVAGLHYMGMCAISKKLRHEKKHLAAFGFTLTGHDELEPGASTNAERLEAMRRLHEVGFRTWASIEPIIDLDSSLEMIRQSYDFCDLYKIGLESGKEYDTKELQSFICKALMKPDKEVDRSEYIGRRMLNLNPHKAIITSKPIYFKDSLLKKAKAERENLPANCVQRDYNIFNH